MTAQVFTAVVRPASTWSTERKKGGDIILSQTEKASLSTCTTAREALAVLGVASKRTQAVTTNSIGKASSVLN